MINVTEIFKEQTALKVELQKAIEVYKVAYPSVKQVSLNQEYTGDGEEVRLTINVESEGESITRKV